MTPTRFATLFAGLLLAFSMVAMDHAEARRGGSFGSRGMKTFQSAPPTRTAPQPAAPIERSMTPNTGTNNAARAPQAAPQRPGFMNGFGGTMMRGLLLGGLFGLLLGQGFGGLAGMFGFLLQALLIGGAIMLAIRFFRGQAATGRTPAMAGAGNAPTRFGSRAMAREPLARDAAPPGGDKVNGFTIPGFGASNPASAQHLATEDIDLDQADLDAFQQSLTDVQAAFGREDYAALRKLVTPEMVSFLSEELADNATKGLRNEVSDVTLLQADIAESWREGSDDYATAAMRYQSRDVMRDRATGKPVSGDAEALTETTELWTFTRRNGGAWKLSAIQEA